MIKMAEVGQQVYSSFFDELGKLANTGTAVPGAPAAGGLPKWVLPTAAGAAIGVGGTLLGTRLYKNQRYAEESRKQGVRF
jgi:hypothetical protein